MSANHEETFITLVRLALAAEVHKKPLRREDIINTLFENHTLPPTLTFKALLSGANELLLRDFGMELVPLPTISRTVDINTVAGRKAATKSTPKDRSSNANEQLTPMASQSAATTSSSSSSSFILVNRMDRADSTEGGLPYHRDSPKMGLLAVILCIISLSEGQQIEEDALKERLALFNIHWSNRKEPTLDCSIVEWIAELKRQRYLQTTKKSDEVNVMVYSLGPRAMLEFPPSALARFVLELGEFVGQTQNLADRLRVSFAL